ASFFILFAAYGVRYSYGVFFTAMASELHFNAATTSAAYSISFLLEGVFSLISGGLADRFGPRSVLTVSTLLVASGYGLMYFVHSAWQLYLFYGIVIGIGMGAMFVPLLSITARWFNLRRNLMTGLVASGAGVGMLIVPTSSAHLIVNQGWRLSFVLMGLLVLVVVLFASQFLKRDPAVIGAVPYGEAKQPVSAPAVSGGLSLKEALRTPQFWIIFAMIFCYGFYSMSINVHIVPDAIHAGMSATSAANILAVSGALLVAGRIVLGNSADRVGNQPIFVLGFILSTVALFGIVLTQAYWVFFVFAAVIGLSQGGIGVSQSPLVATLFGLKSHGSIYGCIGLGFTLGAALGPYFTGYIFDMTGSYHIALLVCAFASIAALIFSFFIKPQRLY
ncbi:MAG TPA: MFS transporter, partial [Dehalococcoidales bacterium]